MLLLILSSYIIVWMVSLYQRRKAIQRLLGIMEGERSGVSRAAARAVGRPDHVRVPAPDTATPMNTKHVP
jgi:hypothetical protein